MQNRDTLSQARTLLALGRIPPWTYVALPVGVALNALLAVLPPLFIGAIIDALQHRNFVGIRHNLYLYIGTSVASGLISFTSSYVSRVQREQFVRNLRLALITKLLRARFDAVLSLTLGEIGNRITGDIQALSTSLETSAIPLLIGACTLSVTIAAMYHEQALLATVALICASLSFAPQYATKSFFSSIQKRRSAALDDFYGIVVGTGSAGALALMRNRDAGRRVVRHVLDITQRIVSLNMSQGFVGGVTSFVSSLIGMIGPITVLSIGSYLVIDGRISSGTLVTLLIYQSRMAGPFGILSNLQIVLTTLGVITRRLMQIVSLPDERGGNVEFTSGRICCKSVEASRGDRLVLKDLDLTIDHGSHVALVGPSGAGKSSLAMLLLRLIDPSRGDVFVGETPATDFSLESLRSGVCVVPQDPVIFEGTILDNLVIASPNVDEANIRLAINACQLNEVIGRLPDGLHTRLGRRGVQLSGGESQRLCLARGLLQESQILILDEALSGVDFEMERRVLRAVRKLFHGRTLLIITHRLGSVADLDCVLFLSSGTVISHGTHEDLRMKHLWFEQAASQTTERSAIP